MTGMLYPSLVPTYLCPLGVDTLFFAHIRPPAPLPPPPSPNSDSNSKNLQHHRQFRLNRRFPPHPFPFSLTPMSAVSPPDCFDGVSCDASSALGHRQQCSPSTTALRACRKSCFTFRFPGCGSPSTTACFVYLGLFPGHHRRCFFPLFSSTEFYRFTRFCSHARIFTDNHAHRHPFPSAITVAGKSCSPTTIRVQKHARGPSGSSTTVLIGSHAHRPKCSTTIMLIDNHVHR